MDFLCPLSYEIMTDPVVTACGQTYDRQNIEEWFRKSSTNPLTNVKVSKDLIPNTRLKQLIDEFNLHSEVEDLSSIVINELDSPASKLDII